MENKKCTIFNFLEGKKCKLQTEYYNYKNGQLDLDLKIEVLSPEPVYGSNILEFKNLTKIKKKDSSGGLEEKPFNIA